MRADKFAGLTGLTMLLCAAWAPAVEIGEMAPGFELSALVGEETIALESYRGQVVFLDFWASWCAPCLRSLPLYEELYQQRKDQGLVIVAVNLDEEPADGVEFLDQRPVSYAVAKDPIGETAGLYSLRGMPTSYLIDRQGRVIKVHLGFKSGDMEKLRGWIEGALDEADQAP